MAEYSFTLEDTCPNCGKKFDQPAALLVNDRYHARVIDGRLVEGDTEADLILTDSGPTVICLHCEEDISVESIEE